MESTLLSAFSFFILFLTVKPVWSAACCGGGVSVPTIITSDDRGQFSVSYGASQIVIDNVDKDGFWRRWGQHQKIQTLKIEGAQIISDRWQWGASLPAMTRTYSDYRHSGLGDISSTLSYEYLPDWNYNPYRPRGIGFARLTVPTGKSKAESELGGLDVLGNGFWAIGFGTMFLKSWGRWDTFASLEAHQSFEKSIIRSSMKGIARPGRGYSFGAGLGYNLSVYRAGISVSHTQEESVQLQNLALSDIQDIERSAMLSVSIGFLQNEEWSWTAVYSDQTLIGDPLNTSLSQSFTLQLQKRWAR